VVRSFRKNKKKDEKPVDEVKDLWIRKTFYVTEKKFPQIERRSLIKEAKEVKKKTSRTEQNRTEEG
jgi:hypothetical protein